MANAIVVDAAGHAYVTGLANNGTYYDTPFLFLDAISGIPDASNVAFVAELTPGGRALVYSTPLTPIGSNCAGAGFGLALDSQNNVYVTGATASAAFPIAGALQGTAPTGTAGFVAKLLPLGGGGLIPWHPHYTRDLGNGVGLSVDLADGHVDVTLDDLRVPGRGPDLTVTRAWDSQLAQSSATSATNGLAASLTPRMGGTLTSTVLFTNSSGAAWPFRYTGSLGAAPPYSAYATPPGQPWQLTTGTNGYTLTDILNGETWQFDAQGRYLSDTDSYGNQNSLTQGANGPTSESNSGGRSLAFGYTTGQLSEVQSPLWQSSGGTQGQHVTYGYNGGGQLTTRTLGAGTTDAVTTTFGYSGTQLTTLTTGAGHRWTLGYDSAGRLSTLTSPVSGTVGQAGYTPAYTTQVSYLPGVLYVPNQTQVVEGVHTSGAVTTTYTLDDQGQPYKVTDALSDTTTTLFDTDHDVTSRTDANGNQTQNYYQYVGPTSSTGLLTETVQPAVQPYSPLNASQVQPVTRHSYDLVTYDLIETDQPAGGRTLYGYDGHHSVITTTQLLTGTNQWRGTVNGYDQYGELSSVTDGRGVTVNASGVATLNAQANQYTRHLGYDPQGDLQSASTAPITTTQAGVTTANTPVTTTYGYDGDGDQTSLTSPKGKTTTYGYDHLARPITTTLPTVTLFTGNRVAPTSSTSYDGEGHVVQTVDGAGDVTQDSYDPLGRLVAETNPVSGTTLMTYTATAQAAVRDPQGNVTTYGYDAAGRLITATAPISGVTQYQYDAAGNTTVITTADTQLTPLQVDTRQYDALNRVITDTLSGPSSSPLTTATRYDPDGNLYQTVNPNGDAVVSTYDLADELVSTEVDPAAVSTATHQTQSTFGYDGAGNQTQATDYGGDTTTSLYDGDNRLTQSVAVTGTSTLTTTSGYDPDGNVITATLQQALPGSAVQTVVDTATYNAADWQATFADNGLTTSYGYDAAGRLRTRSITNGQIIQTLDPEGRTTAIYAPTAGVTSYGYNPDDQPITATLPNSITAAMGYDRNSRLTSWSYSGPGFGAQAPLSVPAPFFSIGRPARNGPSVISPTVNLQYSYGYDAADRTTAITVTDEGVSTVEPITHAAAGWITGWVGPSPNGPQTWAYNGDGNVISTTSYINGGINTTVYTYSATQPNELVQQHTTTLGVDNYTYDGQGNVTSEVSTDPITSPYYVNQHFWYDAQERPISMTNVQNGALITATLGYNAASERISYTAVMSGQVVDSQRYAYNADGSLAQTIATTATLNQDGSLKSSGAYTDTYAYDPQGAPLYLLRQQNGGTSAYTYLTDGHGDVTGLADSSGRRVNSDVYSPFGAPVGAGIQETVPQPFRQAGMLADVETGLLFSADPRYFDINGHFDQPEIVEGMRLYLLENNDTVDNGLRVNPYATTADAGGAAIGAGAVCVGSFYVPILGEIDCATAIALFGIAWVAAFIAAHTHAVPLPNVGTGTRNNDGESVVRIQFQVSSSPVPGKNTKYTASEVVSAPNTNPGVTKEQAIAVLNALYLKQQTAPEYSSKSNMEAWSQLVQQVTAKILKAPYITGIGGNIRPLQGGPTQVRRDYFRIDVNLERGGAFGA